MGHGLSLFFDSKRPVNLFFGLETILKYQHVTMTDECYANHLLFYRCTRTGMLPFCASHGHRWAALVVARIRTTHLRMLNVVRKMKQNLAGNIQSGICSWKGTSVSRGITVLETSDPVQDFTRNLLLVRRHWVYTFYILFLIKLETRFCWRWVPQRNDWVVYPCLCPFLMYGLWKVNTLCSFSCRCSCCKPSSILHNFKSLYHRVFTVNSAADKNKPWANHRFTDPSPPPTHVYDRITL